jgi:FkbH-like protein
MQIQPLIDLLAAIRERDENSLIRIARGVSNSDDRASFAALMRQCIFYSDGSPLFYRRIRNIWDGAGMPALKSVSVSKTVQILSDCTVDALVPQLELFLAAYGVSASIELGEFDSVEFEAHAGKHREIDLTLVVLSERWLHKMVAAFPASQQDLDAAKTALTALAKALASRRSGIMAFTTFYSGAWPQVASSAHVDGKVSMSRIVAEMNATLSTLVSEGIYCIDTQQALHLAGGAKAAGAVSAIRMRAPFEDAGFVALAREIASAVAHQFGRGHRALLTDWDNTIWGGEVGELGPEGVEIGPETPDGYGYQILQSYIAELNALGVALAAVSRNDPKVADVLDVNKHLALRRANYAVLQLAWGNKSESVARVVEQLNFGSDFMVYIDDNHVDLAEVLSAFPDVDVVLAGPEPDQSLARLSGGRFFNALHVTGNDLQRQGQFVALRRQREAMQEGGSREDFIASLGVELTVEGLNSSNIDRVLQLAQKTNQFNLTTRRHNREDVERMIANGAQVGVFDYKDRFGSQGIIGVMILTPIEQGSEIDTWLMSCRVLNRDVEQSMLNWAKQRSAGKLIGTYLPTQKNSLVRDLYPNLGFRAVNDGIDELDILSEIP